MYGPWKPYVHYVLIFFPYVHMHTQSVSSPHLAETKAVKYNNTAILKVIMFNFTSFKRQDLVQGFLLKKQFHFPCTTWHNTTDKAVCCAFDPAHMLIFYCFIRIFIFPPTSRRLSKSNTMIASYQWRRQPSCSALHWAAGGSRTPPSPRPPCDLRCCLPANSTNIQLDRRKFTYETQHWRQVQKEQKPSTPRTGTLMQPCFTLIDTLLSLYLCWE